MSSYDTDPRLFEYLTVARYAARAAGDTLVSMLRSAKVREKSAKDLVTDADVAAQEGIYRVLGAAFPDHALLGEEDVDQSRLEDHGDRLCWVVDPIDGTANYVHGLPNFAVSIALVTAKRPIVGVVFDPMADEMFCAVAGREATLNDRPIHRSDCERLSEALVAASFPPNVQPGAAEIDHFVNVLVDSRSVRRLGSAALNLCFVACGRLDAYWAQKLRSWDVAAGVLIAERTGVLVTGRDGSPFDLTGGHLTAAATPQLHAELLQRLQ